MMSFSLLFLIAAIVRVTLIVYGNFHDLYFKVKYTDIDYVVFSDAARYIINGTSPYRRATYRYTPLLAFLMTPNSLLHPSFGKIFFSLCDLIVGWLIVEINKQSLGEYSTVSGDATQISKTKTRTMFSLFLWLFNPLSMTISTRGNAESFQAVLVLAALLCIMKRYDFIGGLFFGFAVHFKIYPVIFSLPISLYILRHVTKGLFETWKNQGIVWTLAYCFMELVWFWFATSFIILTATFLFYHWYQMEFIENAYLYHMKRTDIKHNFSPYFYVLYLTGSSPWSHIIGLLAFLPQAISVVILGVKYHARLPVACFLQIFAFVTFNKVCTSQYFIWYLSILPIAIVHFKEDLNQLVPHIIILWVSAQGIWLFLAYLLEFQAWDTFFLVWLASIWFLVVNSYILQTLMSNTLPVNRATFFEFVKKNE